MKTIIISIVLGFFCRDQNPDRCKGYLRWDPVIEVMPIATHEGWMCLGYYGGWAHTLGRPSCGDETEVAIDVHQIFFEIEHTSDFGVKYPQQMEECWEMNEHANRTLPYCADFRVQGKSFPGFCAPMTVE